MFADYRKNAHVPFFMCLAILFGIVSTILGTTNASANSDDVLHAQENKTSLLQLSGAREAADYLQAIKQPDVLSAGFNPFSNNNGSNNDFALAVYQQQNTDLPQISLASPISGFVNPIHITNAGDGSGRLFVVEQAGRIRIVKNGQLLATPFLDIANRVGTAGSGMMSIAFPPGYVTKGHFYVYYINRNNQPEIARYKTTSNPDIADSNGGQIVLTIAQQTTNGHVGGLITFNPLDGFLYFGLGDGDPGARNSPGDVENRAQNPAELRGKMLRIDVETDNPLTYTIPGSNPFVNTAGYRGEIWAFGFRNPWRFSFDRQNGDLYLGDNGQDRFEEVDYQPGNSTGGENYGWRIMEGNNCYNPSTGCSTTGLTLPIYEYERTGTCASVIGGSVYRGSTYPRMQGIYFFGDYCSGRISGLRQINGVWENLSLFNTGINYGLVSFGEDELGNLFIADYGKGTIHQIVDSPQNCTYSISLSNQSFTSSGGSGSFNVTASGGCTWTAVSSNTWITITGGASGTDSGTVSITVAANTGSARTGTITVGGQTFTVNQAGTTPTPTPTPTVTPTPTPSSRTNVALSSNGASISASSTYAPNYPASALINGLRHTNNQYGNNGSWLAGIYPSSSTPQTVEVTFPGSKTINEIDLFTMADAVNYNTAPALTDTFIDYGVVAFTVDYWNGSGWINLETVTGNNKVWRQFTFSPVSTTKIRVVVTQDGQRAGVAHLVEVEAWSGSSGVTPTPTPMPTPTVTPTPTPTPTVTPTPTPSSRTNVALSSNGASISASSTYAPNYPASALINGLRHTNNQYANSGSWLSSNNPANSPQLLEIQFSGSKTIDEINLLSLADAVNYTTDPSLTDTFIYYGTVAFTVDYWNGSGWINLAAVTNNNKVWRQFTFSPVTTTKIRVLVTQGSVASGAAHLVELVEVEAWSGSSGVTPTPTPTPTPTETVKLFRTRNSRCSLFYFPTLTVFQTATGFCNLNPNGI